MWALLLLQQLLLPAPGCQHLPSLAPLPPLALGPGLPAASAAPHTTSRSPLIGSRSSSSSSSSCTGFGAEGWPRAQGLQGGRPHPSGLWG